MTFTSQIVRIGEGWEEPLKVYEDSSSVYSIYAWGATAVGAEGSSDDDKELFADSYVDMAKEAETEIHARENSPKKRRSLFSRRKKKKFYN